MLYSLGLGPNCLQFGRVLGNIIADFLMHCFTVSPTGGSILHVVYNTVCVEKPLCGWKGRNEDNVP